MPDWEVVQLFYYPEEDSTLQTEDKMSNWEVAFCRAVGLLWLCLAQTGEAGEGFGFWKKGFVFGV